MSEDIDGAAVTDSDGSDADLGFEPAVAVTGAESDAGRGSTGASVRRRWRRRAAGATVLLVSLLGTGAAYAGLATSSSADASSATDVAAGKQLYENSCIVCHGANLQGVQGRGVPLIGVGAASVYFQVSTGRMPATGQGAEMVAKPSQFTEEQTKQIMAYVESVGGGPTLPSGNLRDGDIAQGGDLFRLNCASCHGTTFRGAPLSAGKSAPSLWKANDAQIYAAMLTGPESMPIFSDNQLTPDQKKAIINYIQTMKASKDPGGNGIDRIGPVSEAVVIWVVGVGALMIAILWIGAKNQ